MPITSITVTFTPCSPPPAAGYNIQYRVVGDVSYIDAGNFFTSPVSIPVDYEDGTAFEGFIRSDCGGGVFGTEIPLFGLRLLFGDISAANTLVGDASSVADWNTFFDMAFWATTPFTQVVINGNEVILIGATGMTIIDNAFSTNTDILRVWDQVNCVIAVGANSFLLASDLQTVILPACETVDEGGFRSTSALNSITMPLLLSAQNEAFHDATAMTVWEFPLLINAGSMCFMGCNATQFIFATLASVGSLCFVQCLNATDFYLPSCTNLGGTTGDDLVFQDTVGLTITLTVPTATGTDGDVVYLQANNTVTLVLV